MQLAEFDYELPAELIAQQPAKQRTASRLLHLDASSGRLQDLKFADFPSLLGPKDLVVLNDTRVVKARLYGAKASGGKVELFVERIVGEREALALMRAGHSPKAGTQLTVGDGVAVEVRGREEDFYRVRFAEPVAVVLERCGNVPLPAYITHVTAQEDAECYQTVYAATAGAVAAPTARLHFDDALLQKLQDRNALVAKLALHVGAGTFQPVRTAAIE